MIPDLLVNKLNPEALTQPPDKANSDQHLSYDSTIYFACRFLSGQSLSKMAGFGLKKVNGEEIILRHLSSCGNIEYTEVFSNVQLENFTDSQLCYQDEGFRTIFITFKYEVEKIYKKFDLCESYGLLKGKEVDETKVENAYTHYTDEQLNEVIEQSEVEANVNLAKQELEKRFERKKKLQEQVNTWNEISKRAENYAKPVTQVSILDELPKISEMEEGVTYIEKGTGSSGKIHRAKKDNDGTTKEEDNKEDIQK